EDLPASGVVVANTICRMSGGCPDAGIAPAARNLEGEGGAIAVEAYVFQNISPLDHRYRVSDPALADQLRQYLSEDAFVRYQLQGEVALTEPLAARGLCSPAVAEAVRQAAAAVTPAEVYQREQQTRHNVRALVNAIRDRLPEEA